MAPPSTPAPSRFLLPRRQGQSQGGGPGTGANPSASQFGATPRFAVSSAAAPAATPSSSRNPPQFFTPAAPPSSRRQPLHELIDSSPASPQDDETVEGGHREHPDRFAVRSLNRRSAAAAHLIVEDFDDDESHSEQDEGREDDCYSSQYDDSSDDVDDKFRPPPKRRRITVSPEPPPPSVRVKVEEDDILATSDLSGVIDSNSDYHEPSDSYPHDSGVHEGIDHIMPSPSDPDGESDYRSSEDDDEALPEGQDEDSDLDLFEHERRQRVPTTTSKKKDPTFYRAPRFVAAEQPADGGPGRPQLQVPADAFSPKRRRGGARGAEYVPGGLAAEVRGWLLQVAPRVGEDGPGAAGFAASVAVAAVPGTVHVVVEEATGSRGLWMLRARRAPGDGGYGGGDDADGLVKIILSGDGRTSGLDARSRVARGATVAAHPPTWEVEIQGQGMWTMVCDWSIVDRPG